MYITRIIFCFDVENHTDLNPYTTTPLHQQHPSFSSMMTSNSNLGDGEIRGEG
jgi:hypothetical protein